MIFIGEHCLIRTITSKVLDVKITEISKPDKLKVAPLLMIYKQMNRNYIPIEVQNQILFLDRDGVMVDEGIVKAICNGIPIDTTVFDQPGQTYQEPVSLKL